MQCSRGHDNPSNAAFCVVCGEQLVVNSQPAAFPAPVAPNYSPPPAMPAGQYAAFPNPNFTPGIAPQNGKGTAALVLGILGLFLCPVIFSVLAIILGVQGKNLADQGLATNRGAAQAGFVLGIIGVVIGGLLFLILLGSSA